MTEVLSYCFFNDLSNAAFCLSTTLRSRVRRGVDSGYPPPPAGCVTIGAPALRGLKEGCHLFDTKQFSQEQLHLNAAP